MSAAAAPLAVLTIFTERALEDTMSPQKKDRKPAKGKANQELLNRLAEHIAHSLDSFTAADMEYEALSVMIPTNDLKAIYEAAGWDYIPTHGAKYKYEAAMANARTKKSPQ